MFPRIQPNPGAIVGHNSISIFGVPYLVGSQTFNVTLWGGPIGEDIVQATLPTGAPAPGTAGFLTGAQIAILDGGSGNPLWTNSGSSTSSAWSASTITDKYATPTKASYQRIWPTTITGTPAAGATITQPGSGSVTGYNFQGENPGNSGSTVKQNAGVLTTGAVTGTPVVGATLAQHSATIIYLIQNVTGSIQNGATLAQATSLATGVLVANLSSISMLEVRDITGSFDGNDTITGTNPDSSTFTITGPFNVQNTTAVVSVVASGHLTIHAQTGFIDFTDVITGTNPDTTTFTFTPSAYAQPTGTIFVINQLDSGPGGNTYELFLTGVTNGPFNGSDLVFGTNPDMSSFYFTATAAEGGGSATVTAITLGGLGERWKITGATGIWNITDTVHGVNLDSSTFTTVPQSVPMDCWPVPDATVSAPLVGTDLGSGNFLFLEVNNKPISWIPMFTSIQQGSPVTADWIAADSEWENPAGSLVTPAFQWI